MYSCNNRDSKHGDTTVRSNSEGNSNVGTQPQCTSSVISEIIVVHVNMANNISKT